MGAMRSVKKDSGQLDLMLVAPTATGTTTSRFKDNRSVAFTGTQRGMTEQQMSAFRRLLFLFEWNEFHHGDCIGADSEAHDVAQERGMLVVIHPPSIETKRAWRFVINTREPKPYIERNHDMVDECWYVIATPAQAEEQLRSGTWATVRYARTQGRCIWLVLPDGSVIGPQP